MKKIALAVAAVSALAVALPSLASAETVIVKHRYHHMDRGWHHHHADRGWHHGHGRKVVVIKHGHRHYD